jgi:polysaccharide biosynthesis/export protein
MRSISHRLLRVFSVLGILGILISLQNGHAQVVPADSAPSSGAASQDQNSKPSVQSLRIGPSDELDVTVFGAPDLSVHSRVDADGNILLPMVGTVQVIGMTTTEAGQAISEKLQQKGVVNHPQVSVFVKEYTNSEISVGGEVVKPGVYSALGPHRLLDILQTAGGPTEKAGNTVTITHRGATSSVTVELSKDPAAMAANNVELQPGDTVIVAQAGIVYVLGEVYRPGGFVSNSTGGVTVLQVIAAAGGPTHLAAAGKTRLLRRGASGVVETPIPLQKLLEGKVSDIPVKPDDILYVPSSRVKDILNASLVAMGSQAAIYRIP